MLAVGHGASRCATALPIRRGGAYLDYDFDRGSYIRALHLTWAEECGQTAATSPNIEDHVDHIGSFVRLGGPDPGG